MSDSFKYGRKYPCKICVAAVRAAVEPTSRNDDHKPTICSVENLMPLINVVLVLLVVGILLWLINTYVPMAGSIKTILNVVVVIAVCVWVLQAFGLWTAVANYRVPATR
jgi:predicted membrane protein